MEPSIPASRSCNIVLIGDHQVRRAWSDAWLEMPVFSAFSIVGLDSGDNWTVPSGEAGLVLECSSGAASACGETVPGSMEIHSIVGLDAAMAEVLGPWIAGMARLLADRVSLRRLVDRFGERVRKESARSRMADLLEEANHRLQEQFVQDPLTGIPNRRRFEEHFDLSWGRAAGEGAGVGLVMVDIDFFKKLNDGQGHQEGDRCLRAVAQAMATSLSHPDGLVARYGGEEFVVVLPLCTQDDVQAIAANLCEVVRNLNLPHHDHPAGRVTISAGAAWTRPGLTSSAEDFLHTADDMLFQAKRTGRDRWLMGTIAGSVSTTSETTLSTD